MPQSENEPRAAAPPALLAVQDLGIRFGGHRALDQLSCSFQRGSLTAIVGPNGAGKTTFFNLLAGQLRAHSGRICLDGEDITRLDMPQRSRRGLGLAFQRSQLFAQLSLLENMRLAVAARQGRGHVFWRSTATVRELHDEAMDGLERVQLAAQANETVAHLPHSDQRKLEVGLLLAMRPRVYLFDEPTAGMSSAEAAIVLELIAALKHEAKHAILLVEHKLDVVQALADRILVLHKGRQIALGRPADVIADPAVRHAYLGTPAAPATAQDHPQHRPAVDTALATSPANATAEPGWLPLDTGTASAKKNYPRGSADALREAQHHAAAPGPEKTLNDRCSTVARQELPPGFADAAPETQHHSSALGPESTAIDSGAPQPAALTLTGMHAYIGQYHILQGIDLQVPAGEITVLLGRNGAGKSTALRSIMGLTRISAGRIHFQGHDITGLSPAAIARQGIAYVPEDLGMFAQLSVRENLQLAARSRPLDKHRLDWILTIFPALKKGWQQTAGTLSGGQKQMLAIARALIEPCQLLLVDEPGKGLAPAIVQELMKAFLQLRAQRVSVLLVEQNAAFVRELGQNVAIMDNGRIVHRGRMAELIRNEDLQHRLLGLGLLEKDLLVSGK